jgi:hypothetical protein
VETPSGIPVRLCEGVDSSFAFADRAIRESYKRMTASDRRQIALKRSFFFFRSFREFKKKPGQAPTFPPTRAIRKPNKGDTRFNLLLR